MADVAVLAADVLELEGPRDDAEALVDRLVRSGAVVRDPLVTELAKAESDLERIEAQRIAAKVRIAALRNELATLDATPQLRASEALSGLAPRTSAGKVTLLPHMGSATIEGRIDMGEKVIINIKTFLDGHAPPDRVHPAMF